MLLGQARSACVSRECLKRCRVLDRRAGFALVLVSWARGGQLGGRGRGYQVRRHAVLYVHSGNIPRSCVCAKPRACWRDGARPSVAKYGVHLQGPRPYHPVATVLPDSVSGCCMA